jgi:hypothetical protein
MTLNKLRLILILISKENAAINHALLNQATSFSH